MTKKQVLTSEELLDAVLEEMKGVHGKLRDIRSWVTFGGILLLVWCVVTACNVLSSIG